MQLPSLSVVIPTYNGIAHLARCLASVCRHAPAGSQILVIDDGSSDGTGAWLRSHYPNVEHHRLEANQGFCQAVNRGLERARGDVVELLNNDTEVAAGWAEASLRLFADPSVGSVAPLAVRMEQPDVIDSAGQGYHICGWAYDRGHGRKIAPADLVSQEVFGPTASCGFYRRNALEHVGGLWTIYGAYFEDTDLAFRLRRAGYRCIYQPASRVAHLGSATYRQNKEQQTYLIARNEEIAFWANLPTSTLLLGLVPHLGFLTVRAARKLLGRQAGLFSAGKFSALWNWQNIRQRRREMLALTQSTPGPVRLSLSSNAGVFLQGIGWLHNRRCA